MNVPAPGARTSPQTLSLEDRRVAASWAADCAEHVMAIYESASPADERVRRAVDQARAFAAGHLGADAAIRTRGGDAGAAARDAPTAAATAAAYAAEQAAAVAHMGAHALGAAGYAGKARVLAGPADEDAGSRVIDEVTDRQLGLMSAAARRAIARLPRLGEDPAGPLGPGRLGSRWVGETIRAIQRKLGDGRAR